MQTIVYAVYAKLNSILDFTDNINQIELLTQKRWLKLNPHHTLSSGELKNVAYLPPGLHLLQL